MCISLIFCHQAEKDNTPEVGAKTYEQACAKVHTAPQHYVIDHMINCSLDLSNRSLGPKAIKPLCKALMVGMLLLTRTRLLAHMLAGTQTHL